MEAMNEGLNRRPRRGWTLRDIAASAAELVRWLLVGCGMLSAPVICFSQGGRARARMGRIQCSLVLPRDHVPCGGAAAIDWLLLIPAVMGWGILLGYSAVACRPDSGSGGPGMGLCELRATLTRLTSGRKHTVGGFNHGGRIEQFG